MKKEGQTRWVLQVISGGSAQPRGFTGANFSRRRSN